MSPNHHRFTTFKEIPPQPIAAADKTMFNAVGIGNMSISIPNGTTANQVMVKDVLYCPELAFTLISLAHCDKAGFAVLLRNEHCIIHDPKGATVGKILLKDGLYKVKHGAHTKTANPAQMIWSIDELHGQMGHISPHAITNIVTKGIVTGAQLDSKSMLTFCSSCARGKMF
jgi:Pol polyprotein, beta-barrel domain